MFLVWTFFLSFETYSQPVFSETDGPHVQGRAGGGPLSIFKNGLKNPAVKKLVINAIKNKYKPLG